MIYKTLSLFTIVGVSQGQISLTTTDDFAPNQGNIYAKHSVKIDASREAEADHSIVAPQPKKGHSQTFNGSSMEESLPSFVSESILKNPDQACEVVKTDIGMSKANDELITKVVETAILVAPDQIRLISQCAIAVAPDSLSSIQLLIASYESSGDANASGKEVSGKETTGKEVTGKKVALKSDPKLEDFNVMRRTAISMPSASSIRRMQPLNSTPPVSISPMPSTGSEILSP